MPKILKEFREFAVKGSVVDLAVGVIIGAAFGAIVKSFVDDVIMPLVGLATGGIDIANRYWVVQGAELVPAGAKLTAAKAVTGTVIVAWGQFLNNILTFLIVAWVIFLFVKAINRLRRHQKAKPVDETDRACPECLASIPKAASRCRFCASVVKPQPVPAPAD